MIDDDGTEPAAHLQEEPQAERGAPGSRDTGSDEPGGGPGGPAGRRRRTRTATPRSTRRARSTPARRTCRPATRPADGRGGESHDHVTRRARARPTSSGKEVPPYEGRRETADVDGEEEVRRDGANVGGATGPVESDEQKAADPADTPAARAPHRPTSGRPSRCRAATRARRRSVRRTMPARPAARPSARTSTTREGPRRPTTSGTGCEAGRAGDVDVETVEQRRILVAGHREPLPDRRRVRVGGRPAARRAAVARRRPGGRLRHPRHAPGLRPARPLGRADPGRRAARRRATSAPWWCSRSARSDVGDGRPGRRARHGPGDRAGQPGRAGRPAAAAHPPGRLPGRRDRRGHGAHAAGRGGRRRGGAAPCSAW